LSSESSISVDVISCPRCARRTAAARGTCLYCGESLPITKLEAAPPQRNIDRAEHAFNAILEPTRGPAIDDTAAALTAALRIELSEAQAFLACSRRVPIARCQSRQEAEMIAELVRGCKLRASVVADDELNIERELMRARKLVIEGDTINIYQTGGMMSVARRDIRLMIIGALRSSRVEYTEGVAGRRGQPGDVIETAEYRSDETLVDVYATTLEQSFRIKADAFDYSGLVRPLAFRAEVNFQMALAALRSAAPHALLDNDYARLRNVISRAWPERSQNEARGLKRAGITRRPVAKASVQSDNRDQFDRYSRLMFLSISSPVQM
jgi:hypothetical protein